MKSVQALFVALALTAGTVQAQQFTDATATSFPGPIVSDFSNQLTIGDLDGDGDLDIVFANGGNFSSPGVDQVARVYINDGNARFRDESPSRTGSHAGLHRGVELGDCDNDGDLDILLAQDFNRLPNLLINNGSGFFTVEGGTRLPAITLSSSRGQFGDIDNDGDMDIFFTSGAGSRFSCGQYRVYLNDGTCNYTDVTATHFPIGLVCNNMDCIFGDIDNDFDIDIRTASTGSNNSRLYRNDGSGVFSQIAAPSDSTCYSYDFGDIDGDGDLDLLGANAGPNNTEILFENNGAGAYANVSGQISPNPTIDDNDSKFLDYDNDGDLDLIVARLGGPERLYNNDGAGNFTQTSDIQAITDSSLDVGVGDLNGDGALDIVTAQGESGFNFQNRVYINSGPADTIPPTIVDTEQQPNTTDAAGPYVVRALILDQMTSDRNFFADDISMIYAVDGGADQSVPMRHSGGQVYRAEIPGQPAGSMVEYWVSATDHNGNTGTGSILAFDVEFDCGGVSDCSGNGSCIGTDTCDCDSGWSGADCSTMAAAGAGRVPNGGNVPGSPLLLDLAGGDVSLSWGASCVAADTDYAVYEGNIGDFANRSAVQCSTGGTESATFTPGAGDTYYLVVPLNATDEGSYGTDSDGADRLPAAGACLPQTVGSCP